MRTRMMLPVLSAGAVLAGSDVLGGQTIRIGEPAPEIRAQTWLNTNSRSLSLRALAGRILVVEFWATTCPPCRTTIPHLNELHEKWKSKGVVVVGLTDETMPIVKRFAADVPMKYIVGTGSRSAGKYGVRGIPHAFIVDPSGRVVWGGHPRGGLAEAIQKVYEKSPPRLLSRKELDGLKDDLADAQRAFNNERFARAHRLTRDVLERAPADHELRAAARELADRLHAIAEQRFAQATASVSEKKYAQAVGLLASIDLDFEGSPDAEKAREILIRLKSNPQAQEALRMAERNARARARFERAERDYLKKRYAAAHRGFSDVIERYEKTAYAEQAAARIEAMMADESIAAVIRAQQVRRDCVGWLSMARNYAKADNKGKAGEYYRRIVETYPDSSYAQTARKELNDL